MSHLLANSPVQQSKEFGTMKVKAFYRSLLEGASTEQDKACRESGAWLMAAPISALGLRMDDDVIRVAAGLHLGLPLCRLHTCARLSWTSWAFTD